MSNRVRVVVIEADGSDAVMGQALAGVLRALDSGGQAHAAAPPPPVLEAPKALAPPPPVPVKRGRPKARQAPLPLAKEGDGARAAILAALAKQPMTSGDLALATGLPKPAVYYMLSVLRKEGIVVSRPSEDSVYPLQCLVKK